MSFLSLTLSAKSWIFSFQSVGFTEPTCGVACWCHLRNASDGREACGFFWNAPVAKPRNSRAQTAYTLQQKRGRSWGAWTVDASSNKDVLYMLHGYMWYLYDKTKSMFICLREEGRGREGQGLKGRKLKEGRNVRIQTTYIYIYIYIETNNIRIIRTRKTYIQKKTR